MQRLKLELSNRRGFTLILSALLLFVFIGAAALAVDVGHMQVRRADVHAASDAAALAGIEEFYKSGCVSPGCQKDSAKLEARAFAHRFRADTTPLTVADADFAMGFWSGTAFSAGGKDTNAAQVTVRYTGAYTFAPVLYGKFTQHISTATSVAVGVLSNKFVTRSTCVSPVVISYTDLAAQLGISSSSDLTQADINQLLAANSSNAKLDTLGIPNGTQVKDNGAKQWVQVNVPPTLTAPGATNPGPPSTAGFIDAFDCTGNPNTAYGDGDWIQPVNGTKAQATPGAIDAIAPGGAPPVTVEVMLADSFSSPTGCPAGQGSSALKGCFHVKYIASFTVTGFTGNGANTSVIGFFSVAPVSGGIVSTDSTLVGPVAKLKTRLVF